MGISDLTSEVTGKCSVRSHLCVQVACPMSYLYKKQYMQADTGRGRKQSLKSINVSSKKKFQVRGMQDTGHMEHYSAQRYRAEDLMGLLQM